MFLLIYVSTATNPLSDEQLDQILAKSRINNLAKGITGILLYKEGSFMQFLEGPKEAVLSLTNTIKSDPRNHGLIVVHQEEHSGREFNNWAMAFKKINSTTSLEVPGYSDYIDLPFTSETFLMNPTKTLEVLLGFKKILPFLGNQNGGMEGIQFVGSR
jgi:hypothetical protein